MLGQLAECEVPLIRAIKERRNRRRLKHGVIVRFAGLGAGTGETHELDAVK
jgi:hypothetical protein